MTEATHILPRFNLRETVADLTLAMASGMMKESTADHIQSIAKARDGDMMRTEACHICGALLMENVTTRRYEMLHDYTKHTRTQSGSMSDAAEAVEAARAASLRRAQREMDE